MSEKLNTSPDVFFVLLSIEEHGEKRPEERSVGVSLGVRLNAESRILLLQCHTLCSLCE